jgi:hypothetical protein
VPFFPTSLRAALMFFVTDYARWDERTAALLEDAYVAAGAGPQGSGSTSASEGDWRAKRQHLAIAMDVDGSWLDVGCANGHLLVTLPAWAAERGVSIRPHGLELLPSVASLARALHPEIADRIWTGSVMTWEPPLRFRYVTALTDLVPPDGLAKLVDRLLHSYVEPGGRLILSSYGNGAEPPRRFFDELLALGFQLDGIIRIDRPERSPLLTAWINNCR